MIILGGLLSNLAHQFVLCCPPPQVMGAMCAACRRAVLESDPRLVEALYLCQVQAAAEALSGVYAVLGRRRARILQVGWAVGGRGCLCVCGGGAAGKGRSEQRVHVSRACSRQGRPLHSLLLMQLPDSVCVLCCHTLHLTNTYVHCLSLCTHPPMRTACFLPDTSCTPCHPPPPHTHTGGAA
jgi:hypothetical protein